MYYTAKDSVIKVFPKLVHMSFYMKVEADSVAFSSCKKHIKNNVDVSELYYIA